MRRLSWNIHQSLALTIGEISLTLLLRGRKSYLLQTCDPTVEWKEGRTMMNLNSFLQRSWHTKVGKEIYALYRLALREWEKRRSNPVEPHEEDDPARAGTTYMVVAKKLGIGTVLVAGGVASIAGVAATGGTLPLTAVGGAIWEVSRWGGEV